MALVMDHDQANDVVQETNVRLCREADQYPTIENFTAWACRVAYFEVLTNRKRRQRDRLVFDDDLLTLLASETETPRFAQDVTLRQRLLDRCLAELSESQRQLILKRYASEEAIHMLADELGRPVASVQQSLYRIRRTLLECVRRKMEEEP